MRQPTSSGPLSPTPLQLPGKRKARRSKEASVSSWLLLSVEETRPRISHARPTARREHPAGIEAWGRGCASRGLDTERWGRVVASNVLVRGVEGCRRTKPFVTRRTPAGSPHGAVRSQRREDQTSLWAVRRSSRVSRATGRRKTARGVAQYVHHADVSHACSGARPDAGRVRKRCRRVARNVEGKYRLTEVSVRPRVVVETDSPTRGRAQDHGRCRGAVLHFKFHQFSSEAYSRVCGCSGGIVRVLLGSGHRASRVRLRCWGSGTIC